MFKFDFLPEEAEISNENVNKVETNWKEARKINPQKCLEQIDAIIDDCQTNILTCGDLELKFICSSDVIVHLLNDSEEDADQQKAIDKAEESHSDLIPAIYEGGLKIWECTHDLIKYIAAENINFQGKHVLDLGCGAGVVGIVAVLNGATCCFQDYNEEVINYTCIPNVLLNFQKDSRDDVFSRCSFYSGDWKSFLDIQRSAVKSEDDKYDYIFTSETIYNPDNYMKLYDIFENLLKKTGTVYLAAKSCYFGVGGNTADFKKLLQSKSVFKFDTCLRTSEGLQREILKICFK